MNILLIGDIIGQPGREAVRELLPKIKEEENIEFTVANAENASGGNSLTPKTAKELQDCGIDVLTNGDHIWKNKEIFKVIDDDPRILRPANYPAGAPGRGYSEYISSVGNKIGVINLLGRVFMQAIDCPFKAAGRIVNEFSPKTSIIIIDFHAEATSEKIAMGWHMDGKVSCVTGTHTHIPTRDARILPQGTAYITDIGMVGSHDSVIGVNKDAVIHRFLTQLPSRFEPVRGNVWLQGAVISIDPDTGRAEKIKPVNEKWK